MRTFPIILLLLLLTACGGPAPTPATPPWTPTPTSSPLPAATVDDPSAVGLANATPTPLPTTAAQQPAAATITAVRVATLTQPAARLPTNAATLEPRPGWRTYENAYLGYTIQYPPGVEVQWYSGLGIDTNEPLPPGINSVSAYLTYLEEVLPPALCVYLDGRGASITIAPPPDWVGRFVGPCPGMGIGSQYRMEPASLTFIVNGMVFPTAGKRLILKDTGAFDSEFYFFNLPNGFRVTYIGMPPDGMSEADYEAQRVQMLEVISTLRWTREPDRTLPGWTCAGTFTRLSPGEWAQVSAANPTPNRIRSAPALGDNIIAQIYPGRPFQVLAGPTCADGLVFWKIAHESIPGGEGWTAEGDGLEYYLEAVR